MAIIASINEAKATLSSLIERAMAGEEIIIGNASKPLIQLVPIQNAASVGRALATGMFAGPLTHPDDRLKQDETAFDAEMHRKWFGEETDQKARV